jgi:hypothetical protein
MMNTLHQSDLYAADGFKTTNEEKGSAHSPLQVDSDSDLENELSTENLDRKLFTSDVIEEELTMEDTISGTDSHVMKTKFHWFAFQSGACHPSDLADKLKELDKFKTEYNHQGIIVVMTLLTD